jgi:hypothetical protein
MHTDIEVQRANQQRELKELFEMLLLFKDPEKVGKA